MPGTKDVEKPAGDKKQLLKGGEAPDKAKSVLDKSPVMFSATVSADYTRKYSFDATGFCKVTAKLVAVPPPSAFLEWVQDTLVGAKE